MLGNRIGAARLRNGKRRFVWSYLLQGYILCCHDAITFVVWKGKSNFCSKVASEPKANEPAIARNEHRPSTSDPRGPQPAGEKERRHVASTRDVGRLMRLFDGTIEALAIAQREQRDVRGSTRPKPQFTITVRDPVCLPRPR
jgi:hypothetical protein